MAREIREGASRCWTASASLRRCYKFRPDTTTKLPPLPGSTIDWAHEGAMVQINHLLSATGHARNATLAEMSARKLSPPIYEAAVEFLLACETEWQLCLCRPRGIGTVYTVL